MFRRADDGGGHGAVYLSRSVSCLVDARLKGLGEANVMHSTAGVGTLSWEGIDWE